MTVKKLILAALVVIIIAVLIVLGDFWTPTQRPATTATSTYIAPQPPQVITQHKTSKGLYLVSYTDAGFQPDTLSIKKSETVRFTNNSSHDLWIIAVGDENQPESNSQNCGSGFNTCKFLKPGEFWEHTFAAAGVIQYLDYQSGNDNVGTIEVQ